MGVATWNTIKANLEAQLLSLSENPKPTYQLDGQMVSWTAYLNWLLAAIKEANEMIIAEEPFEVETQGYT